MPTDKDMLDFIKKHYKENFKFPTYQEIVDELKFKSKASVYSRMLKLEKNGHVEFYGNGYKLNNKCMIELFKEIVGG